jgi:hypothetical protein
VKLITILIIALSLFGNALSGKVKYDHLHLNVPALNQKINFATWDQRELLTSVDGIPDFIGYSRLPYGVAYHMGTTSGEPLTELLSKNTSPSLSSRGSSATCQYEIG